MARKKTEEAPAGAPAWMATFSDLMNLLLCFFVLNILLLEAERMAIRLFLRSLRTNGYNQKHILLVGYSRAAEGFIVRWFLPA